MDTSLDRVVEVSILESSAFRTGLDKMKRNFEPNSDEHRFDFLAMRDDDTLQIDNSQVKHIISPDEISRRVSPHEVLLEDESEIVQPGLKTSAVVSGNASSNN